MTAICAYGPAASGVVSVVLPIVLTTSAVVLTWKTNAPLNLKPVPLNGLPLLAVSVKLAIKPAVVISMSPVAASESRLWLLMVAVNVASVLKIKPVLNVR